MPPRLAESQCILHADSIENEPIVEWNFHAKFWNFMTAAHRARAPAGNSRWWLVLVAGRRCFFFPGLHDKGQKARRPAQRKKIENSDA